MPEVTLAGAHRLEGVVNLNTAGPEDLRLLPGIGPARVRDILAYRQTHPFRIVEELARVKGIGQKFVRSMRLHLAVSGPTTLQKVMRPASTGKAAPKGVIASTNPTPSSLAPPNRTAISSPVPEKNAGSANLRGKVPRPRERQALGLGNHCLPPP